MSKHRWTIVIVPQGSSASKILELSTTALKLAGSVGIAVTLLAMLLGYATVRRSIDVARSDRLGRENTRLARAPGPPRRAPRRPPRARRPRGRRGARRPAGGLRRYGRRGRWGGAPGRHRRPAAHRSGSA